MRRTTLRIPVVTWVICGSLLPCLHKGTEGSPCMPIAPVAARCPIALDVALPVPACFGGNGSEDGGTAGRGNNHPLMLKMQKTRGQVDGMATTMSQARALGSTIEPDLLRGVRAKVAFRKLGEVWGNQTRSDNTVSGKTDSYLSSKPVDKLDDFISHDWGTNRWQKFLGLCVVYNGRAAIIISCAAGIVASVAESHHTFVRLRQDTVDIGGITHELPRYFAALFVSPVAFLLSFLFWQHVRQKWVFVDKLCICQTDEALKADGIRALAGFLKNSSRLLVMWSPRYFGRLWCIYEVATWIYLGKIGEAGSSIKLVPVASTAGMCTYGVACFIFVWSWLLLEPAVGDFLHKASLGLCLGTLVCLLPCHVMRLLVADVKSLRAQLSEFSVQQADCFCCSVGHVHPETKRKLMCDRKVIYATLRRYFSPEDNQCTSEVLHTFDLYVRHNFGPQLLHELGGKSLRYSTSLLVALPMLWSTCNQIAKLRLLRWDLALRYMLEYLVVSLLLFPCHFKAMWAMTGILHRRCGPRPNSKEHMAHTLLCSLFSVILMVLLWGLLIKVRSFENALPQSLVAVALAMLTAWLYKRQDMASRAERLGCTALAQCCSRQRRSMQPNLVRELSGSRMRETAAIGSVLGKAG